MAATTTATLRYLPGSTTRVHLPAGLDASAAVVLEGVGTFANNVTSDDAMPAALKAAAWDEMGEALRSRGLSMVLAYWASLAS